ncbi:hypothetical protein XM38_009690 [Halomicronema hongdechloris C2206]|uniref:DUF29 domain-containing protein n=1 Tax=Halomicronema hongdechloris C2206 TaxID=1641165 RepID=A0A1Z3HI95_9CYAN|nr:DUF29 domain-containing protein [Halomicronema hongdechloris]ASC70039.1 hypothetical protein XM38_009690 [Halomicronema hongdechloris C2206]
MVTHPTQSELATLYERDIALWSNLMADLLRRGQFDQLDLEHLIEEVIDLGRRERDRLVSAVRLILHHLLKWHYQPERRSRSWVKTIQRERINSQSYLEDTPSLKRIQTQDWLQKIYKIARKEAALETELSLDTFPEDCPYSWEQVFDEGFPEDLGYRFK